MPTTFVKGDLFRYPGLDGLAHGCNCAGAMGKGIAVEFRRRYPRMYEEYRKRCREGSFLLGSVFPWAEGGKTIYNLGTQATWTTRAELPAIIQSLRKMVRLAQEDGVRRIGLPRIGAGLGGLDWEAVKEALAREGEGTAVELVVFEEYSRE